MMAKPNPIPELKQRVKTLEGQVRLLLPLIEEVRLLKERMDSWSLHGLEARKEEEKVGSSNDFKELQERLNLKDRELRQTQAELEKLKEESERKEAELRHLKQKFEEQQLRLQQEEEHRAAAEVRADLDETDSEGRTQLHRAAERGDTHTVQLLLDTGSLVNAVDLHSYTPLYLAAREGHQGACRALLAAGARMDVKTRLAGCTALHGAAWYGQRAVCQLLLTAGARPSEPDDRDQWTALHWAACKGHAPVVQLLLQYGAERRARDKKGRTALDLARDNRHPEVADMLED
ncbi:ankyrin repeat domain-containing protein 39-like isoform X1 [Periplaneta americana]|uniref:ankyrin repeat domain-containing protein 39-like isoform X1 n=1 Tax=Periplaneta americana TaxID=6978 RepID=UPI0037E7EEE3